MFDTYGKSGRKGKAPGYRKNKGAGELKNVDTGFYGSQGTFAKSEDNERVDNYAKPGTSAFGRQSDPFETSYPTSRYRSRRP